MHYKSDEIFEITPSFLRFIDEVWIPNEKEISEFNDMMEQEYNARYEGQDAFEATSNFMNYFRLLLLMATKQEFKDYLVRTLNEIRIKKESS